MSASKQRAKLASGCRCIANLLSILFSWLQYIMNNLFKTVWKPQCKQDALCIPKVAFHICIGLVPSEEPVCVRGRKERERDLTENSAVILFIYMIFLETVTEDCDFSTDICMLFFLRCRNWICQPPDEHCGEKDTQDNLIRPQEITQTEGHFLVVRD